MTAAGSRNHVVTDVGGAVDADGTWGHLGDGHDVGEQALGNPGVRRNHLCLNEGQHGIAPSEGKEADDEERHKQLEEQGDRFHHSVLLSL